MVVGVMPDGEGVGELDVAVRLGEAEGFAVADLLDRLGLGLRVGLGLRLALGLGLAAIEASCCGLRSETTGRGLDDGDVAGTDALGSHPTGGSTSSPAAWLRPIRAVSPVVVPLCGSSATLAQNPSTGAATTAQPNSTMAERLANHDRSSGSSVGSARAIMLR